jgi:hypothetical protein
MQMASESIIETSMNLFVFDGELPSFLVCCMNLFNFEYIV